MLLLNAPNAYLERVFKERELEKTGFTVKEFIDYIQQKRDNEPDFLEPIDLNSSQIHTMSSGASYDIGKLTANLTNSYLVTDLYSKWREVEIDREESNVETKIWSPMAKAIQNTPFKYLNNIALSHALKLRKEGRLESMRNFFRKVWKEVCIENSFEEQYARILSEQLLEEVAKADDEWKKIDEDLLKIIRTETMTGLLAAGPLITSGYAGFVAAAATVAGGTALIMSTQRRKRFPKKFPAAFFMKIENE